MKSLHQNQVLFPLLAQNLHDLLQGFTLIDAFRNQVSTELNLVFQKENENLSIQLNTEAKTGLFFFYEYPIQRNGGVFPLFKEIVGNTVASIQAHQNNRSFFILFGSNQYLVFKLYGPLSNVLFYEDGIVKQLFRHAIENDFHLELNSFDQEAKGNESVNFIGNFFVTELPEPNRDVLLSFEPIDGKLLLQSEVVFEALNFFSRNFLQAYLFSFQKNKLTAKFKQQIKRQETLLHGAKTFLQLAADAVPFEEVANIIMANLHQIQKGLKEVALFDFYRNNNISIALKKDLSPADNASYYYQKAKNRKHDLLLKQDQVNKCLLKISDLQLEFAKIDAAKSLKELRPWVKEERELASVPIKEKFRKFECLGFQIYVGKNAKNNDELSLKFAHKEDLWLHAKGVSGSHVIIKHKPQQTFPDQVIERAAQIAAHYSAAAGSQLVPVIFTLKKYVRKPKGAHAGQVAVEREEILLVEPRVA